MQRTGRSAILFAAVEEFNTVHNAWVGDSNSDHPTIRYWDALDELLETFDAGDVPSDCRQLASAVYDLAREKQAHDATDSIDPAHSFWAAREALETLWERHRYGAKVKYRETVKELDRQGVPHEQIARIWGLKHRDGSGNATLVARELEFQGSVIGPDYVHPDDRDDDERAERNIEKYRAQHTGEAPAVASNRPSEDPPCPETSEELWLQKVSIPQAAKMLKRTQDDLAAEWKVFEQGRIDRKNAKEAAQKPAGGAPEEPEAEIPQKPILKRPSVVEEEDLLEKYAPFADWTDDDIKVHGRGLGLTLTGRFNRFRALDRIISAEAEAEADASRVTEDAPVMPQEEEVPQ